MTTSASFTKNSVYPEVERPASPQSIFTINFTTKERVPIEIGVNNLSYIVNPRSIPWWQKMTHFQLPCEWGVDLSQHQVLNSVSFYVKPGNVMAIMGSSGSGKTSLLDVLANRNDGGQVTGEVYLNGVARSTSVLRSCSGYVRQEDRLLPHLTVAETLMFVALLKLPTTFTKEQLKRRVASVIKELGLSHVADSKVGNAEIRGVSGGERRRVSIGIQLLMDPSVLFLDEPTSGLDSFTAHALIQMLSKLAKKNRTILLSIHQPRSDIFELFDQILLLTKGDVVYFGKADRMIDYFTNLGFPCPPLTNPCDFYIDLATIDSSSEAAESQGIETVSTLTQAYSGNKQYLEPSLENAISKIDQDTKEYPVQALFESIENHPGLLRQFSVLCRRSIRNILEDYLFLITQLIQAFAMSLIVGLIYYSTGFDQFSVRDRFGLMYVVGALYPYLVILDLIVQYHSERHFMYYEMEDGLYPPGPYFFAKIFSELPFHTVFVTVYVLPVYFLSGMQLGFDTFLKVYGVTYIMTYCSRTLGMFSSTYFPTAQMGIFLAQCFFTICIMSAGFYINLDSVWTGLQWMSSISYLKWGFQSLCTIEFTGLNFTCGIFPPASCIHTGEEALKQYALQGGSIWEACVIIIASSVVFLILYYIGLKFVPQKPHQE